MNKIYKCKYLIGRKLKIFLAIADRIIPSDKESPGAGTINSAVIVDLALNRLPGNLRFQFFFFFYILEFMGFFFWSSFFSNNNDIQKYRQLLWMENSPIWPFRMGFFGLKNYTPLGYHRLNHGPILAIPVRLKKTGNMQIRF